MENLTKSLYFDFTLFRVLSLGRWIQITASKYKSIFLVVCGLPATLRIAERQVHVTTIGDIGTTLSSLNDEYWDLYKIIDVPLKVVIDVGANIGQFANAVTFWFPDAEVYSFEPDQEIYTILNRNTLLLNVHTYNLALAATKGKVKFYKNTLSGMSSLVQSAHSKTGTEVQSDSADTVLQDIPAIDLLKIDVEGAELAVIQGAHDVLKKTKFLLVEMSFNRNADSESNLAIIKEVMDVCPDARILHTGRHLGNGTQVSAQDFLFELHT